MYKRDKNQQEYFGKDNILSGTSLGVCALETFLCDISFLYHSQNLRIFAVLTLRLHRLCGNWNVFIGAKLLTALVCIYLVSSRSLRVPSTEIYKFPVLG
jgi:hypothetical protein